VLLIILNSGSSNSPLTRASGANFLSVVYAHVYLVQLCLITVLTHYTRYTTRYRPSLGGIPIESCRIPHTTRIKSSRFRTRVTYLLLKMGGRPGAFAFLKKPGSHRKEIGTHPRINIDILSLTDRNHAKDNRKRRRLLRRGSGVGLSGKFTSQVFAS
jgi:hypothetical protein